MSAAALQAAIASLPQEVLQGGPPPRNLPPEQQAILGVLLAGQRFVSPDRTTVRLEVVLDQDPYGSLAMDQIDPIRDAARRALATSDLAGAEVLVGGQTATQADTRAAINRDAQVVGPIVIVAILIILIMLLRSLVAPVYLAASVVLSFLAALGLSTLIFQNVLGHAGFAYRNVVWLFIFLVALGVDYNIYIMSRVREEAGRAGLVEGTRRAISRTGGVIHLGRHHPGRDLLGPDDPAAARLDADGLCRDAGLCCSIRSSCGALLVPSIVLLLGRWNWWPARHGAAAADAPD